nr:EOG090X018J [Ceriodaphnia reticulata]
MDMLNKLKSTVSTTVSQLSGVLPGNPVTREYEVGKLIGSAGPDLLWKIYSGYKKSTKQEASIFVLEKKLLARYTKKDSDQLVEVLRRGVAQLTRIRHPMVLTVQHAVEESRESLAFATEPVFASLANVLGCHENVNPVSQQLKDYKLFEVEIKYGLQQLIEGLIFLHNDVKLLHGNLCPESIIVNQQGAFKIFGFEFCTASQDANSKLWPVREPDPELPPVAQSNLDYLAPELGRNPRRHGNGANTISCGASADMYALGCVIVSIYQNGKSPWQMDGDVESYYRHAGSHSQPLQRMEGVPPELVDHVRSLLHPTPEQRPDAHQMVKIGWFDDVGVKTLNYLDSLFQWDNLQKSQFFKGLPQILPRLPERVCLHRVMPCLAKEFVNPSMVPFILPCALYITQEASKENYVAHILPHLRPVMKIQEPVQVLLIFMQRMELLLQKTPPEDVKSDVLPMIYRALEAEAAAQIQELCLSVIPSFASLIDYPAMKNALMPRIKKLCLLPSGQLSVRVNCLICIGKLLDNVDKWLVLDDILPMLPSIPSKDPAVVMAILGVYKIALEHPRLGIPKEVIATQIVPFLFPLLVEPGLSLTQFRALTTMIKEMLAKVEEEQKSKLESVAALQEEQRTALGSLSLGESLSKPATSATPTSAANSAVSQQIDALFAQLSTSSEAGTSKQTSAATPTMTSNVITNSRIDGFTRTPLVPMANVAAKTSAPSSNVMSLRPAASNNTPSPTWNSSSSNNNTNGSGGVARATTANKDPVSSMIHSNLSAMGGGGAIRPTNQWPSSPAPTSLQQPFVPTWNPSPSVQPPQQPMRMAAPLIPQSPFNQQPTSPQMMMMMPQSTFAQSSTPTTVRPLARSDIDDLLS